MNRIITHILFIALMFVSLHIFTHNSFTHLHDSQCSVYVLEELFFSSDIVDTTLLLTLFLAFTFIRYYIHNYQVQIQNYFQIRAPPSL